MKSLNPKNKLFSELQKKPQWWSKLINTSGIYVDIRKDNYINIYYNGGSIIKLWYNKNSFKGKTHYKYLLPKNSKYIPYDFSGSRVGLAKTSINFIDVNNFSTIKSIKENIQSYYPVKSEYGIQAKFVNSPGSCFIDTEFAYKHNGKTIRIDLVWIDKTNKKILFFELKTMGDARLYGKEIVDQLKSYNEFAIHFEQDIIDYYQKVFEIKKSLNILPDGLRKTNSIDGFKLEKRPLLLMGDCHQNWINKNAEDINNRIKKVSAGAYYFGQPAYNCDLISGKLRNRYVF